VVHRSIATPTNTSSKYKKELKRTDTPTMKSFRFVPAFLTAVAAIQPQGIIEVEWSSNCGYGSKAVKPTISTANFPVIETPKIASAQAEIPDAVPTNTPVIDGYSPIPPAESTNNKPVSDPSVYSPHPEPSVPVYVQREQTSVPKAGSVSPDGAVQSGELTYYKVGLGACGQDSTGQDETGNIVAISKDLFNAAKIDGNSNNNPLCGRTITMKGSNGKTAQGTVLDRCEGCNGGDIDVSRKIFLQIWGSLDEGRTEIEWWYS
jgi:hypothetical protein